MTRSVQALAAAAVPAVFGALAYFTLLADPLDEFELSRGKQQRMLEEYARTQRIWVNLEAEREQLRKLDAMLGALTAMLPTAEGTEIPGERVTQVLERTAGKFGVSITNVEFAATRSLDFYAARGVAFKAQGSFADVTNFLHALAGSPASVRRITALEMRPEADGSGITADVKLEEFAYLDDKAVTRLWANRRKK